MAGLNPMAGVPRPNLPRNTSYRPTEDLGLRLLKYEKPPFGWWGSKNRDKTDFSDCRYWHAPEKEQQDHIWYALGPTLKEYSSYTGKNIARDTMRLLSCGYQASYFEIMLELEKWAFDVLGFDHEWTRHGKLSKELFKLERWYGTMLDYQFAPNWPIARYEEVHGRLLLIQNPEVRACMQCVRRNILCHGHRENLNFVCTPCLKAGRHDRCTKMRGD